MTWASNKVYCILKLTQSKNCQFHGIKMKGREIKICFYLSYLLKRKSENNKREKKKRGVTRIKKRVLEYKPTGHRHLQTVEKVQKLEKKE